MYAALKLLVDEAISYKCMRPFSYYVYSRVAVDVVLVSAPGFTRNSTHATGV